MHAETHGTSALARAAGARLARFAARAVRTRTLRARPHRPLVSFTFDDLRESAYSRAAPILEEFGARGTFYVAGGLLAGAAGDGSSPAEPLHLATPADCRDLHRRGHEIGCHTFSHRAVATLDRDGIADEIARNRACLAALDAGIVPENFAYPFNATSLQGKRRLERHFASCRGGVPGINAGRIDLGFLRAVELADDLIDAPRIRAWIARTVALRGWLIFFSHGLAEAPEPWGCHPRLLRLALSEARAQGAAIVTVREALACIRGETPAASEAVPAGARP